MRPTKTCTGVTRWAEETNMRKTKKLNKKNRSDFIFVLFSSYYYY